MKIHHLLFLLAVGCVARATAQSGPWKGKSCAVVLTYDDAVADDLDHAIPALDSVKLKGSFYLSGAAGTIAGRMADWRKAAGEGHELANHTLFHPCAGNLPGRSFVRPETDLNQYTVRRMEDEIKATNTLLQALDGQTTRTFAYPCGDTEINDTAYITRLKQTFVAARSTTSGLQSLSQVDLYDVHCYAINGQSADKMIDLVKQAMNSHTLLVFLFHGVGGGHALNVDIAAHSRLLHYLKQQEQQIWIAPMRTVAGFIRQQQTAQAPKP